MLCHQIDFYLKLLGKTKLQSKHKHQATEYVNRAASQRSPYHIAILMLLIKKNQHK